MNGTKTENYIKIAKACKLVVQANKLIKSAIVCASMRDAADKLARQMTEALSAERHEIEKTFSEEPEEY